MTTQQQIEQMLLSTGDPILKTIAETLPSTTFYTAWCHTHHTYRGGLADHSLGVARLLMSNPRLSARYSQTELMMAGLLHDICKAHMPAWNNIVPHRHGVRSVHILGDYFHLHLPDDVFEAIRNHMHTPRSSCRNALWKAIVRADHADAATSPGTHHHHR